MENFNLDFILKSGLKLLSSDTQKYEIKDNDLNSNKTASNKKSSNQHDSIDIIKEQRKLLNSKLGIDVGGAANLDTTHLFSDEDLLMASTSNSTLDLKIQIKRKLSDDFDLKADVKQSVDELILSNDSTNFKKIKSESIDEPMNEEPTEEIKTIKPLELFTKWLVLFTY